MTIRLWPLAVTLSLVLTCIHGTVAQDNSTLQAQLLSQPTRHQGTGVVFPANLAGAKLDRVIDYGQAHGQPNMGFSYHYLTQNRVVLTVYIYGEVLRPTDGPDGQAVIGQYEDGVEAIRRVAAMGRYRDMKMPQQASRCTYGLYVFRCLTISAINPTLGEVYSRLLVTGYRGYVLKLRVDWNQHSNVAATEVEILVQTLLGAILK